METPKITKLPNGLTVVTLKRDTLQPLINLRVGVGSRYETEETAGITHNLEHIIAVAQKKLTAQEKAQVFSNMRGYENAHTSHEETSFFCQVGHEHLQQAMESIAEGIKNPHMETANVEKERGAIIAEIRQRASSPDNVSTQLFLKTAYGDGGLTRDITGTVENVTRFTREDLKHHMDQYYTSDNMILTVVGNIDHEEICRLAEQTFSGLPRKPENLDYKPPAQTYRGGYAKQENKEMQQIDFSLGFPGAPAENTHDLIVDGILASIIGGGFSSRLMKKLRTEKSLVYGASAAPAPFTGTGLFVVSEMFNTQDAKEAVLTTCDELKKAVGTITEEELQAIKNATIGDLERGAESTRFLAQWLTNTIANKGRVIPIEEILSEMKKVTVEEINNRARKIFSSVPTVTAYGNGIEKIPSYEEITKRLGHKRELDADGHAKDVALDIADVRTFVDRTASRRSGLYIN